MRVTLRRKGWDAMATKSLSLSLKLVAFLATLALTLSAPFGCASSNQIPDAEVPDRVGYVYSCYYHKDGSIRASYGQLDCIPDTLGVAEATHQCEQKHNPGD